MSSNGDPAFPVPGLSEDPSFNGMTLRDYFAAKALAAILANPAKEDYQRGATGLKVYPKYAYEWADAMMEARSK